MFGLQTVLRCAKRFQCGPLNVDANRCHERRLNRTRLLANIMFRAHAGFLQAISFNVLLNTLMHDCVQRLPPTSAECSCLLPSKWKFRRSIPLPNESICSPVDHGGNSILSLSFLYAQPLLADSNNWRHFTPLFLITKDHAD